METVLHVVGGCSFEGGTMRYVCSLAAAARKARHLVWKHYSVNDDATTVPLVRESRAALVTRKTIRRDLVEGLRDAPALWRWARRNPRAVLHVHSRCGFIAIALVARLLRNPVVTHFHALARHRRLLQMLQRASGAHPVYNSTQTCTHYHGEGKPHTIAEPFIDWPDEPRLVPDRPPRLVAAGALVPEKRPDVLLQAFARVRARAPSCELILFGASTRPMSPKFEAQVLRISRQMPNVRVEPYRADWLSQLHSGDIFVHLGHPESFGMAMLETFARGHRLIVPPRSFLDDLRKDGTTLPGVERLTNLAPESVHEAAEKLLSQKLEPAKLWSDRRQWRIRFGREEAVTRLENLYSDLTARNQATTGMI